MDMAEAIATLILALAGLIGVNTYSQRNNSDMVDEARKEARQDRDDLKKELLKDVSDLKAQLKDERTQREQLEREVRELRLQLARLEGKNEALTDTNVALSRELKEAQRMNGLLESDLRIKDRELTTLREQLALKQTELDTRTARIQALEAQVEAAKVAPVNGKTEATGL